MNTPTVSIIVLTYNQERTIGRTLDSILSQQTNYSYEIIIGEDASPDDNTRAICEEYANRYPDTIHLLPSAPNKGVLRNYVDCMAVARGKYIAGCAGDDWWHDPEKLELQLGFMEAYPEYGVTFTDYDRYSASDKPEVQQVNASAAYVPPEGMIYPDLLLRGNFIAAGTVVFLKELYDRYCPMDQYVVHSFAMEDYPMWLEFSQHTRFKYIPRSTFSYTFIPGSISNSGQDLIKTERFERAALIVREYYLSRYPLAGCTITDLTDNFHRIMIVKSIGAVQYRQARHHAAQLKRLTLKNTILRIICFTPLLHLYARRLTRKS